jgi:hypothetical protein
MAAANHLWGAPRIHGELQKLGIAVSERTVSRLLQRRLGRPPSQTWRTFLANHAASLVSMDFFTVPTLTGRVFFVFVLLAHQRRRIVHFAITDHPTAAWTAQQIIEAFPDETAPRWLVRDRDAIRECLDHTIILSQRHLRRVLTRYGSYYHQSRTHLSLEKDAPTPRRVHAATEGRVVAFAEVGGLHHRYERRAA